MFRANWPDLGPHPRNDHMETHMIMRSLASLGLIVLVLTDRARNRGCTAYWENL
jgi:hypothetical protein